VSFGFLRIFRIMRLLRAARILISIRELYMLLNGLMSSLRAIFFGSFILLAMLVLWAILLVQFVHPINSRIDYGESCVRCPKGLSSVPQTCLTLFQQIVAGDSWGMISIPVIEEAPWTATMMVAIVITVSLGVMNLILAVIVERATEARQNDVENTLKEKEKERKNQKMKLASMCAEMDRTGLGLMTFEDLRIGFETHLEFRDLLRLMDVRTEQELEAVFKILDADHSGDLTAQEFCDQLHDMRNRDTRMTLVFIKAAIQDLQVNAQLEHDQFAKVTAIQSLVQQHSMLLETIIKTLEGMPLQLDKENKDTAPTNANNGQGAPTSPKEPPPWNSLRRMPGVLEAVTVNPWALSVLPPLSSPDGIKEEIRGLKQTVDDLVLAKGNIVSRAQEQAATLNKNMDFLSALQDSLTQTIDNYNKVGQPSAGGQPAARGHQASAYGPASSMEMPLLTRELLERLGDQIWHLKRNTRQRLKVLLTEIQEKVDEEAAMLASNSSLLDALGEMLGSPVGSVASRSPLPRTPLLSRPASSAPSRERTSVRISDPPRPPKVVPPAPDSPSFGLFKCTSMEQAPGEGNIWVPLDAQRPC